MSFDLDAALGEPFEFTFGGQTFTLPSDVDLATVEKLQAGETVAALQALMGDEQYARIEALPQVFGARAFAAVMDAYFQHLGIRQGESSASTDSSKSTGGPSKQTSNGSTKSHSRTSARVA